MIFLFWFLPSLLFGFAIENVFHLKWNEQNYGTLAWNSKMFLITYDWGDAVSVRRLDPVTNTTSTELSWRVGGNFGGPSSLVFNQYSAILYFFYTSPDGRQQLLAPLHFGANVTLLRPPFNYSEHFLVLSGVAMNSSTLYLASGSLAANFFVFARVDGAGGLQLDLPPRDFLAPLSFPGHSYFPLNRGGEEGGILAGCMQLDHVYYQNDTFCVVGVDGGLAFERRFGEVNGCLFARRLGAPGGGGGALVFGTAGDFSSTAFFLDETLRRVRRRVALPKRFGAGYAPAGELTHLIVGNFPHNLLFHFNVTAAGDLVEDGAPLRLDYRMDLATTPLPTMDGRYALVPFIGAGENDPPGVILIRLF